MTTTLDTLAKAFHDNAREKGFHDVADRLKALVTELRGTDPELASLVESSYYGNRLMLIVGELAEAHEELRAGRGITETYYPTNVQDPTLRHESIVKNDGTGAVLFAHKPEGVPAELADVVIRTLETFGEIEVSADQAVTEKHENNVSRPHRHGNKQF